jgi:uncharacterized protein
MAKKIILKLVRFYQIYISPSLGKNCRFWPSCSQYFYLAVEKYGALKGTLKGIKRIIKCYPWNAGGIDIP